MQWTGILLWPNLLFLFLMFLLLRLVEDAGLALMSYRDQARTTSLFCGLFVATLTTLTAVENGLIISACAVGMGLR